MKAHLQCALKLVVVSLFIFILLFTSAALGQEPTGTILGTVTDPSGAVIPGVKVSVVNVATDITESTTTDKNGAYQVINLPIGSYRIQAEQRGFAKLVTDSQKLLINQNLRVDLHLQVGTANDTVTVEAHATEVETVSATLGQSITSRPIVDMPLNGRNVLQLATLQPGVMETNGTSNGTSSSQAGTFSIAGQKSDSVTFLLDGGLNNNLLSNGVVYNPNPDTVAEFRLLTSNYSAEYGRNAGGVVSVVTKSGTNSLHGSAFEFLRNDALNANSYFNKINGLPRDVLKRNQFGFTLGGPVELPKVNGKDRFFWFVAYQGQRLTAKTASTSPTFTPTELSGDFSKSGPGGAPDPGVAAYLQAHPFFQSDPNKRAQAIIDPTRIDPVAQNYIKNSLIPTSPTGTLNSQGGSTNNNNELTMKFDFMVTPKDQINVTLGGLKNPTLTPFSGGANVPGYGIVGENDRYFSNIAYIRTISPTLLNEFRVTAQRQNALQAKPAQSLPSPANLGLGVTPDDPSGPTRMAFDSGLTVGFSPQGPTTLIDNTFVFSDTFSWAKGKHNWKFGATYSPYENNTNYDFYIDGEFGFGSGSNSIATKNPYADFLLGMPYYYSQYGRAPSNIRSKSSYYFAQDEWHVLSNLVLTLGVRYEYNTPKIDTKGRSFSLALGQQSTVFTNAPIGLLFPGDKNAPTGANFPDKNDWAPRFGFAWDPTKQGKMSIRGGMGVFYDVLKGEDNLQFNGQAPFFGFASLNFDPLTGNPTTQPQYVSSPFTTNNSGTPNSFPSKPPAPNINFGNAGFLPFGGGGVYFVDPHLRTPYTYQFNLSVQNQLPGKMISEVAYVGSVTHKQTALVDSNAFILGTKNRIFNAQPGATNTSYSYLDTFCNCVGADYHSLEASLNKQFSGANSWVGPTYFTAGYTWEKSIDTSSGFRARDSRIPYYDHQRFRAVSDYDLASRFTFSGGWDIPFDRLGGPKMLTKGWSVYPILTVRSGFPLDVFAGLSRSRTKPGPSGAGDANLVRADLVGSITQFDPHLQQSLLNPITSKTNTGNFYFNPGAFETASLSAINNSSVPPFFTYGTLPRNFFRGPGRTNLDFTAAKKFTFASERLSTELRADFFNVFNHAEFNDPTTSVNNKLFGQITTTADPRIIQLALRVSF